MVPHEPVLSVIIRLTIPKLNSWSAGHLEGTLGHHQVCQMWWIVLLYHYEPAWWFPCWTCLVWEWCHFVHKGPTNQWHARNYSCQVNRPYVVGTPVQWTFVTISWHNVALMCGFISIGDGRLRAVGLYYHSCNRSNSRKRSSSRHLTCVARHIGHCMFSVDYFAVLIFS